MIKARNANLKQRLKRLVVIGAGNIGSALIPQLGRLPSVGHITIIDHDVYESRNLSQQDILPSDVGSPKVEVQARRLSRINPTILVRVLKADLRDVPLGLLRADVILACLDSLDGRRVASQSAWRLGVPMVDAGVNAQDGLYARVTVYVPGTDAACLECGWDASTYARQEQSKPCLAAPAPATPTNAPASLGALAAAMQAIECRKLLDGDIEHALLSKQALLDVQHHTHRVTGFRRNPQCRFDHDTWQIRNIGRGPGESTFGQVLASAAQTARTGGWARVEGRPFVRKLQCPCCGRSRKALGLSGRLSKRQAMCRDCGKPMDPVGFDMADRLDFAAVDREIMDSPLSRLGFREGDVFAIGSGAGNEVHYEIGGDRT